VTKERQALIQREAKETLLGDAINFPFPEGCDVWGNHDLGDSFRGQVKSKVPALLISGTLDGFTPVSNAEEAQQGLTDPVPLLIEGGGHEDLLVGVPFVAETIRNFIKGMPVSPQKIRFPVFKFITPEDK